MDSRPTRTLRDLLAIAALGATLALGGAPARAQVPMDDPDLDFTAECSAYGSPSGRAPRLLDLATDAAGATLAACAHGDWDDPVVVVARLDPTSLRWTEIVRLRPQGAIANGEVEIRDVALAVGHGYLSAPDEDLAVVVRYGDPGSERDTLEAFFGPARGNWHPVRLDGIRFGDAPPVPAGHVNAPRPSVEFLAVGTKGKTVPGVAWTWAKSDAPDSAAIVGLTTFHLDGRGLPTPTGAWLACTSRNPVALRGDRCTSAELASDPRNGDWIVAFHRDRDLAKTGDENVLVVAGQTPASGGSPAYVRDVIFETPLGQTHRSPTVDVDGTRIVMTTLGEPNGKHGSQLDWFSGYVRPTSGPVLNFVSRVHAACRTPADLAFHGRDLYMAADCEDDKGSFRVHGFFAHAAIQAFPIAEVVEDQRSSTSIRDAVPTQPRVAHRQDPTTDGPVPVFGWSADVDLARGQGVPDEALRIDP